MAGSVSRSHDNINTDNKYGVLGRDRVGRAVQGTVFGVGYDRSRRLHHRRPHRADVVARRLAGPGEAPGVGGIRLTALRGE